jgi:hypothetical protein
MINNIPLNVLTTVSELLKDSKGVATRFKDDNALLHLKAKGDYSNFHFKIIDYDNSNGSPTAYNIELVPSTKATVDVLKTRQTIEGVKSLFKTWLDLISEYPNFEHLNNYESDIDELINQLDSEYNFSITDDDKDYAKYDLNHQLTIHAFLESILEKADQNLDESNAEQVNDFKKETKLLQKQLPHLTKQQVFDKIKVIAAKGLNIGLHLFRDLSIGLLAGIGVKLLLG